MSFIERTLLSIRDFLNGINSTTWGVLILFMAMEMYLRSKSDAAYYFAGIGSTLCGIKDGHAPVSKPGPINTTEVIK